MAQYAINEVSDKSCNALLDDSIRIYQEIETIYLSMQNDLSATSVLKVLQTVGNLNALQQEAQTVDSLIAESLKTVSTLPESTSALLGKKEHLLKRLYNTNKIVVNRAENAKSLLRHEISTMSTNRKAIHGYRPVDTERKGIVSNFF